ncbi:MAG: helicase HerA domain-containing protein, partial [Candidatus Helarchaeota archaeon]
MLVKSLDIDGEKLCDSFSVECYDESTHSLILRVKSPTPKFIGVKKKLLKKMNIKECYVGLSGVIIKKVDNILLKEEGYKRLTGFITTLYKNFVQVSQVYFSIGSNINILYGIRLIDLELNELLKKLKIKTNLLHAIIRATFPQMWTVYPSQEELMYLTSEMQYAAVIKLMPSYDGSENKQQLLRQLQNKSVIIYDIYQRVSKNSLYDTIEKFNTLINKLKDNLQYTEIFSSSTPLIFGLNLGSMLGDSRSIGRTRGFSNLRSEARGMVQTESNTNGLNIRNWDRSNLVEYQRVLKDQYDLNKNYDSYTPLEVQQNSLSEGTNSYTSGKLAAGVYAKVWAKGTAGFQMGGTGAEVGAEAGAQISADIEMGNESNVQTEHCNTYRVESVNDAWTRESVQGSGYREVEHSYSGRFYNEITSRTESMAHSNMVQEGSSVSAGISRTDSMTHRNSITLMGSTGVVESQSIINMRFEVSREETISFLISRREMYKSSIDMGAFMNSIIILSSDRESLDQIIGALQSAYVSENQIIKPVLHFITSKEDDPNLFMNVLTHGTLQKCFLARSERHPIGGLEGYLYSLTLNAKQMATKLMPPREEIEGILVDIENIPIYPVIKTDGNVKLGISLLYGKETEVEATFDNDKNTHIGIFGKTGFGKTISCLQIVSQLMEQGDRFFILDPKGSGDYLYLYDIVDNSDDLLYFTFKRNPEDHSPIVPLKLDLLRPLPGFSFIEWLKLFLDSLVGAYGLRDRSRMVLQDLILNFKKLNKIHPTLSELKLLIEDYLENAKIDRDYETRDNLNRILLRIKNFIDFYGDFFDILPNTGIKLEDLFDNHSVIMELGALTDQDDLTFVSIFFSNALFNYRKRFPLKDKKQYLVLEEICSVIPKDENYTGTVLVRKILSRIVRESRIFGLRLIFLNQLAAEFRREVPEMLSNIDCYILHRLDPRDDRQILGGLFGWQDSSIKSYKVENLRHILRLKVGEVIYRAREMEAPMHVRITPEFPLDLVPDFEFGANMTRKYLEKVEKTKFERRLKNRTEKVNVQTGQQNNTGHDHQDSNVVDGINNGNMNSGGLGNSGRNKNKEKIEKIIDHRARIKDIRPDQSIIWALQGKITKIEKIAFYKICNKCGSSFTGNWCETCNWNYSSCPECRVNLDINRCPSCGKIWYKIKPKIFLKVEDGKNDKDKIIVKLAGNLVPAIFKMSPITLWLNKNSPDLLSKLINKIINLKGK